MYYVYILRLSDQKLYKGVTNDLQRRITEHKFSKVISTKNKRPARCVHYETYLLTSDAVRREKFLKTTEGRRLRKPQLRDIFEIRI